MAQEGIKYSFNTMLLAAILDGINLRNWSMSENARNGAKRPQTMVNKLLGISDDKEDEEERMTFDSGAAYEEMRKKLLKGCE